MKILSNNKLIPWIIIVLIISNVLSITALAIHIVNDKNEVVLPKMRHPNFNKRSHYKGNCFFDNLELNEKQMGDFTKLRETFMEEGHTIMTELRDKRHAILAELHKESPDSLKLTQITQDIGSLHIDLKVKTIDFYLNMKKDCSPEQEEQLNILFKNMNQHGHRRHYTREKRECNDKSD